MSRTSIAIAGLVICAVGVAAGLAAAFYLPHHHGGHGVSDIAPVAAAAAAGMAALAVQRRRKQ
jgi:uncharacterized protein (TIGR03382 family)